MKEIRIFLASSEELEVDRLRFSDIVRQLDEIYEKRGTRIRLLRWEHFDASYHGVRTQDEYNIKVRNSQIFVALFHKKAGSFTIEEWNVAKEEFSKSGLPKIYTYIRAVPEGEVIDKELEEFKAELYDKLGHFWCNYSNTDTMRLHFIMQLENSGLETGMVVDNSEVKIASLPIALLSNVPFVANNNDYERYAEEISELEEELEELKEDLEAKGNADTKLIERINKKSARLFSIKKELNQLESNLLSTARTIVSIQNRALSKHILEAVRLFESGKNREADAILRVFMFSDIPKEIENYLLSKEVMENRKASLISELKGREIFAKNVLTIFDNPDRFDEADRAYAEALKIAKSIELNNSDLMTLYDDYNDFLWRNARYKTALTVAEEWLHVSLEKNGTNHEITAKCYMRLGVVYHKEGLDSIALDYYLKSLTIRRERLGEWHTDTAACYNNIGNVYLRLKEFEKALENHEKSVEILQHVLGHQHYETAVGYDNLGITYRLLNIYDKALTFHSKALEIALMTNGTYHPFTAACYNNIATLYSCIGKNEEALKTLSESLKIKERVLPRIHPDMALAYYNFGVLAQKSGKYTEAISAFGNVEEICSHKKFLQDNQLAQMYWITSQLYARQSDVDGYKKYLHMAAISGHPKAVELLEKLK